jgi:hypothetical protein
MAKARHLVTFEYTFDEEENFEENMREIIKHIKEVTVGETFKVRLDVEVNKDFEQEVNDLIKVANNIVSANGGLKESCLEPCGVDKDGETLYKRAGK